ncbi:MAG: sigma-70 family RNA polymerase sigma factor [Bryobacteraceae bacterium]|nr:sigma-70 family RNA polymerase sigma factor [Bryobacteraceae bacterium]
MSAILSAEDDETMGLPSLDECIDRYQHRLYRFLLRLLKDPTLAEDLFQQTWLQVMRKSAAFDASRDFEPWLFSVARNLALDYLRKSQPESLDEPLETGSKADALPSATVDALERLLASERSAVLLRALNSLPTLYREVLTLRFEEEMKLEQMAAVLAMPLPTVKTRLHRGLRLLRDAVGGIR